VGEVVVDGRIAPPPARLFDFGGGEQGAIRQNLDLETASRESGLALRPLSVQQTSSAEAVDDGLQRRWPAPAVDVAKHHGYAFQWFALCGLIAVLYVWFQIVRPRLGRTPR
jgi:surfeit locus 1 family protein